MAIKRRRKYRPRFFANPSLLRYLRVSRHLSQAELAKSCGNHLTANDISKAERGNFRMSTIKFMQLADYYGVSLQVIAKNDFSSLAGQYVAANDRELEADRRRTAQARKDDIGARGEDFAAKLERERLAGTGLAELVCQDYANYEYSGFDLLSFTHDGSPMYVEVKTSVGGERFYYLSACELEFAKYCHKHSQPYKLVRINYFDDDTRRCVKEYSAAEVIRMHKETSAYRVEEAAA